MNHENPGTYNPYPQARFVVLSDLHFYHPSLGTSSPAFIEMFQNYREIKMIRESGDILQAAIKIIVSLPVDFVIICGDLTKDGELVNHWHLARELKKIAGGGKKVYVINGNHDINNIRAYRYSGEAPLKTATVTTGQFADIYQEFGYASAIGRDTHSLSYVVEPVPGLWLLAVDSCYKEFREDGRLNPKTLAWTKEVLIEARKQKKAVFGMMHHGILEHYRGNKKYFGAYVVDNSRAVGELFRKYGLNIVFTGHFHAQDIALKKWPENSGSRFIYDIETGSLVTYPCPYRIVSIDEKEQKMRIMSSYITSTAGYPEGFRDYAYRYAYSLTERFVVATLKGWRMSDRDISIVAPQVIYAFEAHCTGNEQPPRAVDYRGLSLWGRIVLNRIRDLVDGLYCSSPPPDNSITIDLATGDYSGG